MAAERYTARIEHNEDTIEKLYKARYHAYEKLRVLIRMLIGVALVFTAAFVELSTVLRGFILLVGAWLMVSSDFPAALQADKALQNRKAKLPVMEYVFHPDRVVVSGEGSTTINYKKFEKLSYDRDYFFLFESGTSVCMVDRSSLRPEEDVKFMKFIMEKTGREWQQEKSFLSLNLYDIRRMLPERQSRKKR